jgi:hypothetical protein
MTAHPAIDPARFPDPSEIDESYVPRNEAEFTWACQSWRWRIYSGWLYKIIVKSEDPDDPGTVQPFIPNGAQRDFLDDLALRNVILKARQLGFTTLIAILWLDHALWHENQRVGIIAHSLDDAGVIFRDKVRFAYDQLPGFLREKMPLRTANKSELVFDHNNSAIRVSTSMRSGTINRLHVSEMGKIAAKFPDKATEIVTGSLPAVPHDGIAIIESTAEGQAGEFYKIATRAQELHQSKAWAGGLQWRFHFFPWWTDPAYSANPDHARMTDDDQAYFDQIEDEQGTLLSMRQRAWYVMKRDDEMGGDHAKMWREYPSKPEECWQQSTEGRFYAKQLAMARVGGRIKVFEYEPEYPTLGFWDIGSRDGAGLWLMQKVDGERRFLKYIENWFSGFATTIDEAVETRFRITQMYLPHDAEQTRQTNDGVLAPVDILREMMPAWQWIIVPRVATLELGIEITRKHFAKAVFHAEGCKQGLIHLSNYQQRWNSTIGAWAPEHLKNEATEAADSFRQWAQMEENGLFQETKGRTRYPSARVV